MLLAMKFGWSRHEIMALSAAEMGYYLNKLSEIAEAQ